MKISKLFHWLYACIMFLPLLAIPIFAINIINRSPQPISIEVPSYEVVDFNQLINYEYNSSTTSNGVTITNNNDGSFNLNGTSTDSFYYSLTSLQSNRISHKFYIGFKNIDTSIDGLLFREPYSFAGTGTTTIYTNSRNNYYFTIFISNGTTLNNVKVFPCWIDLTQMFGVGNEPTIEQFNQWYPNYYYDYTLSKNETIYIGDNTLNDTDIGSQYVYSLYHVVDKYFNFNNILPFEGVYNWFLTNVFFGVSPVGFTLLYNLLMYWLFVSLIWLMFDVFMYVPLVIHNFIDKGRLE